MLHLHPIFLLTFLFVTSKKGSLSQPFTEYHGRIMLSPYGLAQYEDIKEARYYCIMSVNCTGISSWPHEHFPVTGTEMVLASTEHVVHLKTSKDPFYFFRYWGCNIAFIRLICKLGNEKENL